MRSPFLFPLIFTLVALCGLQAANSLKRAAPPPPPPPAVPAPKPSEKTESPLVWDATEKKYEAHHGEVAAEFVFSVTNTGAEPAEIAIFPSCGCTVATLPASPWILAPGAKGSFTAKIEFAGKHGTVSKTLQVASNRGQQTLWVTVNIPETDEATRRKNQELARKNRQLVFQNDCAACHATPLAGKMGAELFTSACGICHQAPTRASIVPDLQIARETRDEAYWRKWIAEGKADSLMPAFAQQHGGPLTSEQIDSLVEYVLATFPRTPKVLPKL